MPTAYRCSRTARPRPEHLRRTTKSHKVLLQSRQLLLLRPRRRLERSGRRAQRMQMRIKVRPLRPPLRLLLPLYLPTPPLRRTTSLRRADVKEPRRPRWTSSRCLRTVLLRMVRVERCLIAMMRMMVARSTMMMMERVMMMRSGRTFSRGIGRVSACRVTARNARAAY